MSNSRIRQGRRGRVSAAVASLAVAGLVLTACSSGDGDDTASDSQDSTESSETQEEAADDSAAEESTTEESGGMGDMCGDDTIRIGISLPLTGDFSQPGQEAQRGYDVWAELTNNAGGLLGRPVELVVLDDASSQEQVVTDYNNLISQEKVPLLLGTFSSLLNFPASTVAENNEMVLIAPAGGSPKIFEPEPKFYFFAQQATAPDQANPFVNMIESLPDDQKPKTAAYVSMDDPFALPVIESMQEQLEAAGVETVYTGIYPEGTTNLQPQAAAIAAEEPDLIAQGSVFEDGISLAKSMVQIGYSPDFMFQTTAPRVSVKATKTVSSSPYPGARRPQQRAMPNSLLSTRHRTARAWCHRKTRQMPTLRPRSCRRQWKPWEIATTSRSPTGSAPTRSTPSWVSSPGMTSAARRATSCSHSGKTARLRSWHPRWQAPTVAS